MNHKPLVGPDAILCQSLQIAMDYLKGTGRANDYRSVERRAIQVIIEGYRDGICHRISLANRAIVAVEKESEPFGKKISLYPKVVV
jgi:hypothetical protein